jgi:uncharacterized protein YjbI with pentapeptide repeats
VRTRNAVGVVSIAGGACLAGYSAAQGSGSLGPYMPWMALGLAVAAALGCAGLVLLRSPRPPDPDAAMPVIAWWWVPVALWIVGIAVWGTASLLTAVAESAHSPTERATLRFDALKTALTVGAGVAGVAAILLGLRRQWLNEHAQRHLVFDSTERRVTDLYTKAADQLGHESAAVRMAGLYALERVAQSHRQHRQTILDVICAYLRMRNEGDAQEVEVRRTAERIITDHLRWPGWVVDQPSTFWESADLDLRGADLTGFSLENCRLRRADFRGATLHSAYIVRATFAGVPWGDSGPTGVGGAYFDHATFDGPAIFEDVEFHGDASFNGTVFRGTAFIGGVLCRGSASFRGATFFEYAAFEGSEFLRGPDLTGCRFSSDVSFASEGMYADGTKFGDADFTDCEFYAGADFTGSHFASDARAATGDSEAVATLEAARVVPRPSSLRQWPSGYAESGSVDAGGFTSLRRIADRAPKPS